MFCPHCAAPESERTQGNPGAGAWFITFVCGTRVEARDITPYSGPSVMYLGNHRAAMCMAMQNANPHNLNERIARLEALATI